MNLDHLKGTTAYVVGLGRSGIATINALKQSNVKIYAWDDASSSRGNILDSYITLIPPEELDYSLIDYLVISPGIPNLYPFPHPAAKKARKSGVPLICDVELFAQAIMRMPVEKQPICIGITGTNGKSTVTAMMAHVLNKLGYKAYAGGNIGNAVFNLPDIPANEFYILELSSYQLELIETPFLSAALLINIAEDHLERHGGMKGYIAAKEHIFRLTKSGGKNVIGIDDTYTLELFKKYHNMLIGFSATRQVNDMIHVSNKYLINPITQETIDLQKASVLKGNHNYQNIAACYTVLDRVIDLSIEEFSQALSDFTGLPHRQEFVLNKNGILFVNDSKATSLESVAKSLENYKNIYWILGGRAKSNWQKISIVAPYFDNIRKAYTFGESGKQYENILNKDIPTKSFATLDEATKAAYEDATLDSDESVVLLSPACSSFDQFRDFEDRGEYFKTYVKKLVDQ
jgi:UDP-N-acetylmuramoylalanine--D-glutamate ligase